MRATIDGKVIALHARVRWVKGHTLGLRALGVRPGFGRRRRRIGTI